MRRLREGRAALPQSRWRSRRGAGREPPQLCQSLNNLASCTRHGGPREGRAALPQALEIHEAALGENHPDYATSLINLAELYYSQGQLAAAEQSSARD